MAELERDVAATLEGVRMVKGTIVRVLGAWDTYSDSYTSLHAWLEQGPHGQRHGQRTEVNRHMHYDNQLSWVCLIHALDKA